VSTNDQKLCPFSKPIISFWCDCPHASLMEHCSGKMACNHNSTVYKSCNEIVDILKDHSSFIVGQSKQYTELTHAHSMKIRCGGILGMQRVMKINIGSVPVITEILAACTLRYGNFSNFPYSEIIQDIKVFNHRKKQH